MEWLATDLLYLVLAPSHGLEAVGALRAAFNLIMPILHGLTAISIVSVPWFVPRFAEGISARPVLAWWGVMTGGAVVYALLLLSFTNPLVRLAYGDSFSDIRSLVFIHDATTECD